MNNCTLPFITLLLSILAIVSIIKLVGIWLNRSTLYEENDYYKVDPKKKLLKSIEKSLSSNPTDWEVDYQSDVSVVITSKKAQNIKINIYGDDRRLTAYLMHNNDRIEINYAQYDPVIKSILNKTIKNRFTKEQNRIRNIINIFNKTM